MALNREEALDEIVTEGRATEFLNVPSVREALHAYLEDEITEKVERSKKYNHMFALAFSVNTDVSVEDMEADDDCFVPVEELREALIRRIDDLFRPRNVGGKIYYEIHEAIGFPEDTYENGEF